MFRNAFRRMLDLIVVAMATTLSLQGKTVICYSAGNSNHYTIYPKNIDCADFIDNAECKCVTDCWHMQIRTGDVKVFVNLVKDKLNTLRSDALLVDSIQVVDSLVARLARAEERLAGAVLLDGPFRHIAAAELYVGKAYTELTDLFDRITAGKSRDKDSITADVADALGSIRARLTLAVDELERIKIDSTHAIDVSTSPSGNQYAEVKKTSGERLLINVLPSNHTIRTGSGSPWNILTIAAVILALVAILGVRSRARRERGKPLADPVS